MLLQCTPHSWSTQYMTELELSISMFTAQTVILHVTGVKLVYCNYMDLYNYEDVPLIWTHYVETIKWVNCIATYLTTSEPRDDGPDK